MRTSNCRETRWFSKVRCERLTYWTDICYFVENRHTPSGVVCDLLGTRLTVENNLGGFQKCVFQTMSCWFLLKWPQIVLALSFSRRIANFTRPLVSARREPCSHNQVSITQPIWVEWNRPYQGAGCGTDGSIPGAQVDSGKGVGCDSGRAIPLQKKKP